MAMAIYGYVALYFRRLDLHFVCVCVWTCMWVSACVFPVSGLCSLGVWTCILSVSCILGVGTCIFVSGLVFLLSVYLQGCDLGAHSLP